MTAASTDEVVADAPEEIPPTTDQPALSETISETSKKIGEKVAEKLVAEAVTDVIKETAAIASTKATEEIDPVLAASVPDTAEKTATSTQQTDSVQDADFEIVEEEAAGGAEEPVVLEPLSSLPVVEEAVLARIAAINDTYCTPVGYHMPMAFKDFISMKRSLRIRQLAMVGRCYCPSFWS